MLFKKFQSVPANTTESAPNWQKLQVMKGTIKQWIIFFDPEAADLLHIKVVYHGSQLIPWAGNEWLTGFFTDNPILENIKLDVEPYVLDIYAYNEDDSFPHQYYIHPIITREEPFSIKAEIDRLSDTIQMAMSKPPTISKTTIDKTIEKIVNPLGGK